jgi:hypothetical protein
MDDLAAGLLHRWERGERAVDGEAGLLGELAPGRGERILARLELALGDRPGAGILLGPERAAGMDEEHFRRGAALAIYQQAGALLGHGRARSAV